MQNDELHELYSSLIIRATKSRTIRVAHAVRMGEKRMHIGFWMDKTRRKTPW